MPEENTQTWQQSLKDQAKALWAKVAWSLNRWWDKEKREFTFWVSKQSYIVALILLVISIWAAWAAGYFVWEKNEELIARTWNLKELNQYNLSEFQSSDAMNEDRDHLPSTIDEMIAVYNSSKNNKERLEWELYFKTSVYNEFLRNFLLPSLNIWKDPYTKKIDIDILGRRYLDMNPYQDISLLSQWSSIIRDSWKDVWWINEVTDMRIWDIQEEKEEWYFKIPITVSFKSNSKRAFLLLVDKLSLTSNVNNLWLLNDFTYYLFNSIREKKSDEIKKLIEEYGIEKPDNQDEKYFNNVVISRYLYNWIFWPDTEECRLIDDDVIDNAVRQSIICWTDTSSICYFRFRDKYRNIPELAYSIGLLKVSNKPLVLKRFFADIPPLIAIESFTFDKQMNDSLSISNNVEYIWDINFSIYGRGLSQEEMDEITKTLAAECFGSWTENDLSIDKVLEPVQTSIEQIGELGQNSVDKMSQLIELRSILNEDKKEFKNMSPYNQMIRKFEYYRMLKNVNLCKMGKNITE